MSTIINASCDLCRRELQLSARDITLNVSARFPGRSHYLFMCPCCEKLVQKPATEHVIALLHGSGVVPMTPWEPAVHPERHRGGPPLNDDDLIAFGLLLHAAVDVAWWAR